MTITMNRDVKIDASRLLGDLTMNVVITGQWKMNTRVWVATRLISLAAWVLGTNIDVDYEQDPH